MKMEAFAKRFSTKKLGNKEVQKNGFFNFVLNTVILVIGFENERISTI